MTDYDKAEAVLTEQLGHNVVFALATSADDIPTARNINGYYKDGAIYITSHTASIKMQQIAKNPRAGLCRGVEQQVPVTDAESLFQAWGDAENLGHPLEPQNKALRDELRQVFIQFYDAHVNEKDEGTCLLKIQLTGAVLFDGEHKYIVRFADKNAEVTPFKM
ncbi:pyridoxamine 5'-phosphate oxidase family protein [Culicoidibacter larvae]|nr:pyridoxamine 5'-phosphate oxidase family protein [Culicoidibacter larvae]